MLPHIESQEAKPLTILQTSNRMLLSLQYPRKLDKEILGPALRVMDEWNNQAEIIKPWQRSLAA
ncbi:MAG: hypothetical protein A2144_08385 [Chloroflexi bacterium RBG_16_50_9]|nr:MAG: hypothetical protein A2144_08385 [Chloroflexi bacterium RBG_16_50_9]